MLPPVETISWLAGPREGEIHPGEAVSSILMRTCLPPLQAAILDVGRLAIMSWRLLHHSLLQL